MNKQDKFSLGLIAAIIVGLVLCVVISRVGAAGRFEDVPEGAWYDEAVAWAVENGITDGVDAEHFAPNDPCTRAQVVTFLWRYDQMRFGGGTGEPTPTEPAETEPIQTEPVETEPVVTEPAETEAPTEPIPAETEPEETQPVETEPPATEPQPSEPTEPVVFEYTWTDMYWSGEEIILEPLSGGRVCVFFPGIGEQFRTGDTVTISYSEGYSAYMRGAYTWWLDMSLAQPITELLNQTYTITVIDGDEIVVPSRVLADVDVAYVCMIGSQIDPAMIRVERR